MKLLDLCLGLIVLVLLATSGFTADPRTDFDFRLSRVIARLNREAQTEAAGPSFLAEMIEREYATRPNELKWAAGHSVHWGDAAALAYINATTGRTFEKMTSDNAREDFWSYVEKAEMDPEKMVLSLENFVKVAEKERNTKIFERLRTSRRVQPMPDLGSGFGLFQESLDFRRIDSIRTAKIHNVTVLGK